jgi:hypothetical protein
VLEEVLLLRLLLLHRQEPLLRVLLLQEWIQERVLEVRTSIYDNAKE